MALRRGIALVSLVALLWCGVPSIAGAQPAAVAPSLQRALNRLTARPDGPPGAIVVIQRGSHLRVFRAGVSNVRTHTPMQPWMHMRIASTSKAYNGAVALSLVADGRLSLGDTVGMLLPWAPRNWWPVTLGEALHHTSGLPDFSASTAFLDHLLAHLRDPVSPRRLLHFVAHRRLVFHPGSRFRYSNSDNIVVGLMVQAVTGRRYEGVLGTRVFGPLGLRHTSLPRGVRIPGPYIRGYGFDDHGRLEDQSEVFAAGYSWAAGGIISTPLDQNRFIRGYVGGALFGAGTQGAQFRFIPGGSSEPPGPGHNAVGLAIFRYRTRCGTMFGHTGNTLGYTQFFAASSDGRRSAVVAINSQASPKVLPDVFDALRHVFVLAVCAANTA